MYKNVNKHDVLLPLELDKEDLGEGVREIPKFHVCDIEASKWTNFLILGHYDGREYSEFMQLSRYIDFLARLACEEKSKELSVFAHYGGGYDFSFLIDTIFFQSPYMVTSLIERGSGLLSFEMTGEYNGEKFKVIFRDSTAILPFALKTLTKTFNVAHKKQEMDHTKVTRVTNKLREYLRFDCVGLYECLEKYFRWHLFDGVELGFTVAGQAIRLWRKFLPCPVYAIKNQGIDEFIRGAYFGGRTEVFRPLWEPRFKGETMKCYDMNSLYPTVMQKFDFPCAFSHETDRYEEGSLGIYDAEAIIPDNMWVPPLPVVYEVNKTKKLIFPTGRIKGRWTTWEIDYCRRLGIKIKTGFGVIFENGGKIFKPYIETLYALRKQSAPESVDNILTKLYMNGLYGRTGLRLDRETLIVDDGRDNVEPHMVIEGDRGRKIRLVKTPKRIKSFTNVAIATFVTAASRLEMHPYYLQCKDELYYTDTDSLYTTVSFPSGKELGELKLEDEYTEGVCFLLPKTYIGAGSKKAKLKLWQPDAGMNIREIAKKLYNNVNMTKKLKEWNPEIPERDWKRWPEWKPLKFETKNKITMKGFVGRKVSHFKLEDFKAALEGEMRRLSCVMPPKFAKLRSAGQRGRLLMMLPASPRQIRAIYDKRVIFKTIDGFYYSKPLSLDMRKDSINALNQKKENPKCDSQKQSSSQSSSRLHSRQASSRSRRKKTISKQSK